MAKNRIITSNLNQEFIRSKNGDAKMPDPIRSFTKPKNPKPVTASYGGFFSGGTGANAVGDVNFYADFPSDPYNESAILYQPQNRLILNAWLRYWDMTHPLIGSIIDLHATYPFSRFEYGDVDDDAVLDIYRTADEKVSLFKRILEIAREYWLIGEVIIFKSWDSSLGIWDKLHLLNPDDVEIEGDIVIDPEDLDYYWIPPQLIRDIIQTPTPYSEKLRDKLDPSVISSIEVGEPVPLDKFSISHIARRPNPYNPRGQSIVTRCISTLQYEEQLISAQRAIAQRHIFPLQIYKIGDSANNFIPESSDLEAFRDVLMSIAHDPNKALIYHDALEVDFQGTAGQLLDMNSEFDRNENRILTALFTNKAFTTGEGPTWSNATVAARMLSSRYITMRHLVEDFIKNDFCKPIAVAHGLYKANKKEITGKYKTNPNFGKKEVSIQKLMRENECFFLKQGKFVGSSVRYKGLWMKVDDRVDDKVTLAVDDQVKKLNIPSVKWMSKINLLDDMENKQIIADLFREKKIPMKIMAEVLDLDYKSIEKGIAEETNTLLDPYVMETMNNLVQDTENSRDLIDQYSEKVIKKSAERGINLSKDIFPKLEEEGGEDFGTIGGSKKRLTIDQFKTPLEKLSDPLKIKKLETIARMAYFDRPLQKALKVYCANLAKKCRMVAMQTGGNGKPPKKVEASDSEEKESE